MTAKIFGKYTSLAVSLVICALLFLLIVFLVADLQSEQLIDKLLFPVGRILLLVGVGLVVGEMIENLGWTRFMAVLARPLFSFGHLGSRCSAVFTTAFFSGVAANSMLVNYYNQEKISKQQMYLTNFINHLPAFFLHLPTTIFIVLPLTGTAGGIYLLLVMSALILRLTFFLLYGHIRLASPQEEQMSSREFAGKKGRYGLKQALYRIRQVFPARFARIAQYVIPIFFLIFLVNALGLFDFMRAWLAATAIGKVIPVESLSMVVIAFLADYTSGFATVGALLQNEVFSMHQAVIALLIGNIVSFPLRALRHQLPRYLGIFSPAMGTQILLLGQTFRVLSLIIIGVVYYWLFI